MYMLSERTSARMRLVTSCQSSSSRMAVTFVRFGALMPLTSKTLVTVRCLSVSSAHLLKRPTFEGPQLPKKPPNAYSLFILDNMNSARMADSGRLDVKKLGEMWKSISQTERDEYLAKYTEQKRVHQERVEEFMKELGGKEEQEAYLNSLAEYRAKRRAYLKSFRLKKLGLIKPRRISGHNVFAGERLREAGGSGLNVQLIKEIPLMWKTLSDEERKRYQEMAEEHYVTRLAEYERRLKKAQEDGIVPAEEPKELKKAKKPTKDTKKSTSAKKKASQKPASGKSTAKKTSGTKKSATSSKSAKSVKLDEDADQWIS